MAQHSLLIAGFDSINFLRKSKISSLDTLCKIVLCLLFSFSFFPSSRAQINAGAGFGWLLPEVPDKNVDVSLWQLNGKVKRVMAVKMVGAVNGLHEYEMLNNADLEKLVLKTESDSNQIHITSFTFNRDGKINTIATVHLQHNSNAENHPPAWVFHQIPISNYSYIDTSLTIYQYNTLKQLVRIAGNDTFEVRRYDQKGRLSSAEYGLDNPLIRSTTNSKCEFRYFENRMEVFETSMFSVNPIKKADVIFRDNRKVKEIVYETLTPDTTSISTYEYDEHGGMKQVQVLYPKRDYMPEGISISTSNTYNEKNQLQESVTLQNGTPKEKVTYVFDNDGLLTNKTTYRFDATNRSWKIWFTETNLYLKKDQYKNPTQIRYIKGDVQYNGKVTYSFEQADDLRYEYYE